MKKRKTWFNSGFFNLSFTFLLLFFYFFFRIFWGFLFYFFSMTVMLVSFNQDWKIWKDDDSDNQETEMFLDNRNSSKEEPRIYKWCWPKKCSEKIVVEEWGIFHISDSSYERSKGSHDRYKSSVDDCFPSVFLIKVLGFFKVFLFDSLWFHFEDFWSEEFSNLIVETISKYCSHEDKKPEYMDIDMIHRVSC